MKLEPGIYKIEQRGRLLEKHCHYLTVFVKDQQKFWQLNSSLPQRCDEYGTIPLDEFTFKKKLNRPLIIKRVRITVDWLDEDEDKF